MGKQHWDRGYKGALRVGLLVLFGKMHTIKSEKGEDKPESLHWPELVLVK
jgi:hypothetical protein